MLWVWLKHRNSCKMIIFYPAFLFPIHKYPRGTPSNSDQPRTALYHATLTFEEWLDICRYTQENCWLGSFLHNWHRWSSGRTSFVAFRQMEGQIWWSPLLDTRVPVGSRMLQRFHFGLCERGRVCKLLTSNIINAFANITISNQVYDDILMTVGCFGKI